MKRLGNGFVPAPERDTRVMTRASMTPIAKLRPPQNTAGTLLRSRLLDALYEHADCKLQFILAPPGFGKTTLLADFVQGATFPSCWATLDATDQDPLIFLETLSAALQTLHPGIGERMLEAARARGVARDRIPHLARLLALDLEERLTELTVLVIDDYQEADSNPSVSAFIDELLRTLPDALRLLIAGRSIPNITVSRLIVERQVFGLGEQDLRFNASELMTLARRLGHELEPRAASLLAERSEGWIAGFLMSVPELWQALTGGAVSFGGGAPLFDYLAAEVFDRQPEETQRFLLLTSVPDTVDEETALDLLGAGPWEDHFDHIERAGLFVARLGSERLSFRYHQLFREFLRARLRRSDPVAYAAAQRSVAERLAQRGAWVAAIRAFTEAGVQARGAELLAAEATALERAGHWRALVDASAALEPDALAEHPALLLSGARAALHLSDVPRAEALVGSVLASAQADEDSVRTAWALTSLGHLRRLQGRTAEAQSALTEALTFAGESQAEIRATALRHLGKALGVRGDLPGAIEALSEALVECDRSGAAYDAAQSEYGLAVAFAKSGRIAEAIARYESCLARWRRLDDPLMEAETLNSLGYARMCRGDHDRSRADLEAALNRAMEAGAPLSVALILHSLSETLLAAGDLSAARRSIEQGLAIAGDLGELWVVTQLHDALALALAFSGEMAEAEERAYHALALAQRQESKYLEAVCSLTLGAIRSRRGRPDAIETLQTAAEALETMGALREAARAVLWLAQAYDSAGAREQAMCHLKDGLSRCATLGVEGLLDLHVRWDGRLFEQLAAGGEQEQEVDRALGRATVVTLERPPDAPHLPAFAARAFGPGIVTVDDERPVAWKWEKTRELFFYLLHLGPRRREQILTALWPDTDSGQARTALHTAVYRLRKAACPEVILTQDGLYRINEELVLEYDARAFERLLKEAAAGPAGAEIIALQAAVDLYRGPFLEETEAEWRNAEQQRLERLVLGALERLSDLYAQDGRRQESIAAAERLLAIDPSREDIHARVIQTYLRLGDRAAAQRQMERCVTVLRDEWGIEPGPELAALRRRLDG